MCVRWVRQLVISGQTCRKLTLDSSKEAIDQLNFHDFYNEIELVKEIDPDIISRN